MIGTKLGSYEIIEEVGRGGMAIVYLGNQARIDRQVAVKVIKTEDDSPETADSVERFEREARIIAKLEHPHIMPVYDFDMANETPFIVMRYLNTGTLRDLLDSSKLTLPEIVHLMEQMTLALDFAHRHGVVHRDIKPANIMMDSDGNAIVTDFGLARSLIDAESAESSGEGVILGTPHYMSPEQALGEGNIDGRADIYALGVMLFEMVTGQRPFSGTIMEIILAHVTEPVPSLLEISPDYSDEIDSIIARAMAKEADQRYQTAGDFRAALKEVLAHGGAAEATQNIANVINNSATPYRRRIRFFLSAPPDMADELALAEKVIQEMAYDPVMRGRILFEIEDWSRFSFALTPEAAIVDDIPLPQESDIALFLVWGEAGPEIPDSYTKPAEFQYETDLDHDPAKYISRTEWEYVNAQQGMREQGRPHIAVYQRETSPFIQVTDPEFAKKHREWQLVNAFAANVEETGNTLYKFVTPSEFEKLIEEHIRELISDIVQDERTGEFTYADSLPVIETDLWEGSPFPGLRAFGPDDAPIFFGRGAETDDLVARLKAFANIITVVGASGSGKSSLVGSGLLPRLTGNAVEGSADWKVIRFTPDETGTGDPFDALAAALRAEPLGIEEERLAERLRSSPLVLQQFCLNALDGEDSSTEILLFIDQFEEIFTRVASAARQPFALMLQHAINTDRVRIIATIRADFYDRFVEVPALAELMRGSTYPLSVPGRDSLREMIERPAARAGLQFEPGLVRRVLDDTGSDPGALALLAFALQQLYEGSNPEGEDGLLSTEAYNAFGGVQGAIGQQAQQVFEALDDEAKDTLPAVFSELVAIDERGEPTRRRTALDRVAPDAAAQRLVNKFTERRLLVQSRGDSGQTIVEVAHEALFRSWPLLADWIVDISQDLAYGAELLKEAKKWQESDHDSSYLLQGVRLDGARAWLQSAEQKNLVESLQREFIEVSQQRAANRRRLVIGSIAAVVSLIVALSLVFGYVQFRSSQQAKASRLATEVELALNTGDAIRAYQKANEAYNTTEQPDTIGALYSALFENLPYRRFTVHEDRIRSGVFSSDGSLFVTASSDGTARVWNIENNELVLTLPTSGTEPLLYSAAFSPDGSLIITAHEGGDVKLWNADNGLPVATLRGHTVYVATAFFDASGEQIVTAGNDGLVKIWELSGNDWVERCTYEGHERQPRWADFSPDGQWVASSGKTGTLHVFDPTDCTTMRYEPIPAHNAFANSVSFTPDGAYMLSGGGDGIAKIWDAETGENTATLSGHAAAIFTARATTVGNGYLIATSSSDSTVRLWGWSPDGRSRLENILRGHADIVFSAYFSPDGEFVATTSEDATALIWQTNSVAPQPVLGEQTKTINVGVFNTAGTLISTASNDNTVRLWDAENGKLLETLEPAFGNFAYMTAFSPDDSTLVATSSDSTEVRIWDAETFELLYELTDHDSTVYWAAYSLDSRTLATASADDTAMLWDLSSGEAVATLAGHTNDITRVIYAPDGETIVTASLDGTARVWSSSGAELETLIHDLDAQVTWTTFSQDGSQIVTAGSDGVIKIWDASTYAPVATLNGHSEAVTWAGFSPDGAQFATTGQDGLIQLWDANYELAEALTTETPVLQALYIESGEQLILISASADGIARRWDARTGRLIADMKGHSDAIVWLTESPDGTYILSSSEDSTARLWYTDVAQLPGLVCSQLDRVGLQDCVE